MMMTTKSRTCSSLLHGCLHADVEDLTELDVPDVAERPIIIIIDKEFSPGISFCFDTHHNRCLLASSDQVASSAAWIK